MKHRKIPADTECDLGQVYTLERETQISQMIKEYDKDEHLIKQEQFLSQLEFNENIIYERNEEIQQIYQDVLDITEIFKDLNKIVHEQSEPIVKLEKQMDSIVDTTKNAVKHLKIANEYQTSWFSKRNKIILMSIAGLSINIPITLTLGLKAGAISGLSTIGLSAFTSLFSK